MDTHGDAGASSGGASRGRARRRLAAGPGAGGARGYPARLARAVFYLGIVVVLGALVGSVRSSLSLLLAAFLLAYMLDPAVDALERRKLKRGMAIVLLILSAIGGVGLAVALVVPFVQADLRELSQRLPQQLHALAQWLPRWLEANFGFRPPADLGAWLADLANQASTTLPNLTSTLGGSLAGFARGAAGFLGALVSGALVPFFAFFLLRDFDDLKVRLVDELVPHRYREAVAARLARLDDALGGYVRGQLMVCACLGIIYTSGLLIGRVPFAFVVGPLAGLASLVPFLGSALFLVGGLVTALLEAHGFGPVLAVAVTLAVAQVLEGLVLTPRFVGTRVGLSAFGVVLSLSVFGEMLGFVGLVLAVPLGATLKILWPDLRRAWRTSRIFGEAAVAPAGVAVVPVVPVVAEAPPSLRSSTQPPAPEPPEPAGP